MNKFKILLICCLQLVQAVSAQEEENSHIQLEQWTEQQEKEIEQDDSMLEWEQLERRPVPISKLTNEQLILFGLTALQLQSFHEYVRLFGFPSEKYELQAIPYWDIGLIKKILPYLDFSPTSGLNPGKINAWKEGDHQLMIRTSRVLEKSKGFQRDSTGKSNYTGSPQRLFFRYSYQLGRSVWLGFSMEKDAGETFGRKGIIPADFTGFHLFLKGKNIIKAFALGDFTINAGQGLVVWQGMAFGKGSDGAGIFRQGPLLKPYRSAGEINFFRGTAVQMAKGKWESVSWISRKKRSATMQYEQETPVSFSSISESGYHRSATELASRNKLNELVAGMVLRFQWKSFRVSLNNLYQQFPVPWLPKEEPYNLFYFRGRKSFHHSLDYSFGKKQFFLFGEIAKGGKGWGTVHGILASVDPKIDWSIVYRNFQPEYHAYYANALAEQAAIRNEEGIYSSWQIRPGPGWKLHVYVDFFRFPWLRFRTDAPSGGREGRLQVQWEKRRSWLIYGVFRTQSKMENLPEMNSSSIVPVAQQNLRIHIQKTYGKQWLFSTRLDQVWFKKSAVPQKGWGLYADTKFQLPGISWQLAGRLHWFKTDGYTSRIYAYERDLLYSYSIPAFFDHGWRYYLQWQGKFKQKILGSATIKWWLRWSKTMYTNKDVSGSGWDEIQRSSRSEWKFQMLLDW